MSDNELKKIVQYHSDCIKRFDEALFGNKDKKELGIYEMTTQMHSTFRSLKFSGKFILGFFAGIGVISGGIFALIKLVKAMV